MEARILCILSFIDFHAAWTMDMMVMAMVVVIVGDGDSDGDGDGGW